MNEATVDGNKPRDHVTLDKRLGGHEKVLKLFQQHRTLSQQ